MDDLSVPFRKAAAKLVKVVPVTAAGEAIVTTFGNSKLMWLLVAGIASLLFYFFIIKTPEKSIVAETFIPPTGPISAPDPLRAADAAFERFEHASNFNNKESEYGLSIQNYLDALASADNPATQGHVCFRLASLYHQGIPETFDASSRTPGIAPDAQQAIMYYREAIKFGFHGAVLPLAGIYHWGLTGFEGNREVAQHLYGVLLKVGSDYEKGIAKDRLRQMREEEGKSLGSGMLEEDTAVATTFTASSGGANPFQEHFMDIGKSKYEIGHDETTRGMDEKYIDDLIRNKLHLNGKRIDSKNNGAIVKSDPQNARDHVVVNSAKQSLERLRANTHMQYDVPTTFKMLHEYITKQCDLSEIKRENAARVLQEMAKGIANLGYEQSKEIEALQLVWNRIHSQTYAQERDKRKLLTDNLVCELAECIEYGELVCPTGRFNRIIDSLNHLDPMVQIQPQWAIRQTMTARAGVIQKELLNKCRAEVRDAANVANPNARERQLQAEFSQKLKSTIEREFIRTYVETGLMTKELLKTELDAWML